MELTCNGIRIAYEQRGAGAHVTLIHGLTANGSVWKRQVEQLARTHQVLTYDLRGHGTSEKPADGSVSFEAHVEDLRALLEQLGVRQTALVGWSMGASIATLFAARSPERVSRLVLIGGTPMLVAQPDFAHAMPPQQQAGLVGMAEQDFDGLMRTFCGMMMPEPHDEALDAWLHEMAMQAGKETFLAAMRQLAPVDIRPSISEVRVPTLVLHGGLDVLCPPTAGQYFAEAIRGASFQLFEEAGHAPMLTRPEAVTPAIARFLAG